MKFLNTAARGWTIVLGFIAAVLFMVAGVTLHVRINEQNKTYTGTVDAVVTDYEIRQEEQTTGSDNNTTIVDMYYPIFEYTVDGKDYKVTYDTGTDDEAYERNVAIQINYLPSDPTQFFVSSDKGRNFIPYILYVASIATLALVGKLFIDAKKAMKA